MDAVTLAQIWAHLPPSAQRLALCESARVQRIGGYDRGMRHENVNGEAWQVCSDGETITLSGQLGNDARREANFRANVLRSSVGTLTQKLKAARATREAGEANYDETQEARDPLRSQWFDRMDAEELAMRNELAAQEAELAECEKAATVDGNVSFSFPVRLMEDPSWA